MRKPISLTLVVLSLNFSVWAADAAVTSPTSTAKEVQQTGVVTAPGAEPTSSQWTEWMIEGAKAGEDYVHLIDEGRYGDSWDQGAQFFQKTIPRSEWVLALNLARKRLGAVKSRTIKDQKPAMNPKGLPKGAYMVLRYSTSFAKAPNSGEDLTLMREADGKWKVLTYQVN